MLTLAAPVHSELTARLLLAGPEPSVVALRADLDAGGHGPVAWEPAAFRP